MGRGGVQGLLKSVLLVLACLYGREAEDLVSKMRREALHYGGVVDDRMIGLREVTSLQARQVVDQLKDSASLPAEAS